MNSKANKILKARSANKLLAKSQPLSQPTQQPEKELAQQLEIEQPDQPESVVHLESLLEPSRDESVYGSGWSLAELMNEFGVR